MILQNPRKAKKISSCETVRKVTTPAPGICTVEKVVIFSTVKFLCEKNRAPFLDGNAKQLCCKLQQNFLDNRLPNGKAQRQWGPLYRWMEKRFYVLHAFIAHLDPGVKRGMQREFTGYAKPVTKQMFLAGPLNSCCRPISPGSYSAHEIDRPGINLWMGAERLRRGRRDFEKICSGWNLCNL